MERTSYLIDIDEQRQPYNTRLVLTLSLLRLLMPLLREELMRGLINSRGTDKVELQLSLDSRKIEHIKKMVAKRSTKRKSNRA